MEQEFDPYLELLGIPKAEQPPNCYRLLGIPEYTSNKQVIANGAARQMQFLRRVGGDQYLTEVQKILNEISKVRIVLLDDEKRLAYDRTLREKERKRTTAGGADSESGSISRSQSQFDLSAPAQKDIGRVAAIQLTYLSGPKVGQSISLQRRDITIGPSSGFDVMMPTRNGSKFKLEHEIDQWILSSEDTAFAVNGRLVNGLTTVRDGDILRFSADGPDVQLIEEIDLLRHLDSLADYQDVARKQSSRTSGSFSGSRSGVATRQSQAATRRMSNPMQSTGQQAQPAQQRPAQPTRPHQSKLVKKPESQKKKTLADSMIAIANKAMGREKSFTKKTGVAIDWQIGVFWLAVGGTLAGICALIIFAVSNNG